MAGREELENGEFLILKDDTCHLVGQESMQIQFTPAILYLTNQHIFLDPRYDVESTRKLVLGDVVRIVQTINNDCPVLDILSEDSGQSIHVFIPDESHRIGFASILRQLCKAKEKGQRSCDKYAMNMRRSIQNAESLSSFYKSYNTAPDYDQAKVLAKQEKKLAKERKVRDYLKASLIPFNFISDFLNTCPEFFFATVVILVALLSSLFSYISIGVFFPSFCLLIIFYYGKLRIMNNFKPKDKISPEDAHRPLRPFIRVSNEFQEKFDNRIKWGNAELTLEVTIFLTVLCLLFLFVDPAILLVISIFGLALIERWDPIGSGCLSYHLSRLISW